MNFPLTSPEHSALARGQGLSNVLHVISGLGVGGAEGMLTSLLIAQSQTFRGEVPHVVSLSPGGANAQRLRAAGIRVTELRMHPRRPPGWELFRLARLLWLNKPAIVQSWMYHADLAATLALYWSGRRQTTRLIWGLRCSDMDTRLYGIQLKAVIRTCALLSSLPNAIVSNSVAGRDFHIGMGYPSRRFVVIPNGIDVDRFRPDSASRDRLRAEFGIAPNEHVLAHVARVDPMKDHECFLQSLELLPGIRALMIGQGTENLPAHPSILRLGRRDDIPDLLNTADIIVSSSAFGEGFSNAVAEGMASGLPAVVTDTGDARRLVGDTGIVVPPRDPRALAAAIASILSAGESSLRVRGRMARERVEDLFSLRHAIGAFQQLYAEV